MARSQFHKMECVDLSEPGLSRSLWVAVAEALQETIRAHGLIGKALIPSAVKRIKGAVKTYNRAVLLAGGGSTTDKWRRKYEELHTEYVKVEPGHHNNALENQWRSELRKKRHVSRLLTEACREMGRIRMDNEQLEQSRRLAVEDCLRAEEGRDKAWTHLRRIRNVLDDASATDAEKLERITLEVALWPIADRELPEDEKRHALTISSEQHPDRVPDGAAPEASK